MMCTHETTGQSPNEKYRQVEGTPVQCKKARYKAPARGPAKSPYNVFPTEAPATSTWVERGLRVHAPARGRIPHGI